MKNVLLVASREFRQIVAMRSFWLTLLILPVALALGPIIGTYLDDAEPTRIAIVDRSGRDAGRAITERLALERDLLVDLARYVQRYDPGRADPSAPWARLSRYFTPADVAAYREQGGLDGAREPQHDPPPPDYAVVRLPAVLNGVVESEFADRAEAFLSGDDDAEPRPDIIVAIGRAYPAEPRADVISADRPRGTIIATVQDVLTTDPRARTMTGGGLSPDLPLPGGGAREVTLVRPIVPLAMAYILMMALLLSGSWMLQSSVEERSNKLLESVLACIAQSFTWIPLWKPFSVLARLGTGIATWEKMATGILVALFIAFEFVFLGRLFRQSLLASGQKPGFGELLARMRRGRSAQG